LLELDSVPHTIEEKLNEGIKVAKEERFNQLMQECPNSLKKRGYESVDQIPEYIVFTELYLKFSDHGNGLERSEIVRSIVDTLEADVCSFEVETSFHVDLLERIDDLRQLALNYLEKIMLQKKMMENYIL